VGAVYRNDGNEANLPNRQEARALEPRNVSFPLFHTRPLGKMRIPSICGSCACARMVFQRAVPEEAHLEQPRRRPSPRPPARGWGCATGRMATASMVCAGLVGWWRTIFRVRVIQERRRASTSPGRRRAACTPVARLRPQPGAMRARSGSEHARRMITALLCDADFAAPCRERACIAIFMERRFPGLIDPACPSPNFRMCRHTTAIWTSPCRIAPEKWLLFSITGSGA
jgi:hypothetical protein